MFPLVYFRHVGAHPDEHQLGVSIQSSINLGKSYLRTSRMRIIPSTQILARVFVYLPPFISQILDFICRMVLIFILIYFEGLAKPLGRWGGFTHRKSQQLKKYLSWSVQFQNRIVIKAPKVKANGFQVMFGAPRHAQ